MIRFFSSLKSYLFFLVLSTNVTCCLCADYDITFYNVGQGNCTIVRSPTRKVLFVDAGSSSTLGIAGIDTDDEGGKYEQLSSRVVDFVKDDLDHSQWLYFIISHPDKDHLNLVRSIISKSKFVDLSSKKPFDGYMIGVLFGGDHTIYSKGDKSTACRIFERK